MRSDYGMCMDSLAGDFDTVYSTLMRDREKQVSCLANQEANPWARKRALARVTEIDKACAALVNIMGAMETSCEYAKQLDDDFMPETHSELA